MFKKLLSRTSLGLMASVLVLGVSCSKKNKNDQDGAGDSAISSDLNGEFRAGTPIPGLDAVTFAYDSFSLDSDAKQKLATHIEILKQKSSLKIQVEGHCDERGTTEYNLALGEKRAVAVKDFLASKGIGSERVATISYGEERALAQGSNEAAYSKNRRAEFVAQ